MNKLKNLLVQYRGGGYSGCVWEWNFFCFDKNEKFYNIFTSGSAGVKDKTEALGVLGEGGVYQYDLASDESLAELAEKTNEYSLKMLIKWFNDNLPDEYKIYAVCSACGSELYGDIGDTLEDDRIVCGECYHTNSCTYCGYYGGKNSKFMIYNKDDIKTKVDVVTITKLLQPLTVKQQNTVTDSCEATILPVVKKQNKIPAKIVEEIVDSFAPVCVDCFEHLVKEKIDKIIRGD